MYFNGMIDYVFMGLECAIFVVIFLSLTIFLDMSSIKQTLLSSALEKECGNLALVLILQEVNVR